MSSVPVLIPDIGDAEDVEVIEICVGLGEQVDLGDPLIVIESEKASMELPAPMAGRVELVHCELGDIVNTDDLVVTLSGEVLESVQAPQTTSVQSADETVKPKGSSQNPELIDVATNEGEPVELEVRVPDVGEAKDITVIELLSSVGDDVLEGTPLLVIESDKASMEIVSPAAGEVIALLVGLDDPIEEDMLVAKILGLPSAKPQPIRQPSQEKVTTTQVVPDAPIEPPMPRQTAPTSTGKVYAGPAVRKLARELGVDLNRVTPTGAKGRIVKDDVKAYVKEVLASAQGQQLSLPEVSYPDFEKFGEVELSKLSRMRRVGATNLVASWLNVVHVTQHDEADVSELEHYRKSLNERANDQNIRLTPLPFIFKACAETLKTLPNFNASILPSLEDLVVKKYIHIGMAVDTPFGLVVPVVRDVLSKSLAELAEEIRSLAEGARTRRLRPEQLAGASFTISSLGRLGGTGFTPIINAPEVAILGVGRTVVKPIWNGAEFEPKTMLPLSLSYDHRAINGAEGGSFMQEIMTQLANPDQLHT